MNAHKHVSDMNSCLGLSGFQELEPYSVAVSCLLKEVLQIVGNQINCWLNQILEH